MAKINSLRDIIQFNSNFKTAINLYLSLNKAEKVLGYIPTKSFVSFLGEYLKAVLENKEQATLLVGPYGKGKSPWLIDKSLLEYPRHREPDEKEDNIRIYVPMDLNKDAILRRLDNIIGLYGEAREDNEIEFSIDVGMIISQLEIYDQIWFVRHMPKKGEHSREAKELVTEIIARLEDIPDGCAECFPFELIDELKQEYLTDNSL